MIAEATRRSPLADYVDRFGSLGEARGGRLAIREVPFLTQINLRTDPHDALSIKALIQGVGVEFPTVPNRVFTRAGRSALWLGPDEWLIVAAPGQAPTIETAAQKALAGSGSVVDVSANRTTLQVAGSAAAELLAFGCAVDLGPRTFGEGRCVQTMLAKAQVIIEQTDATPAFHLYVRASFAGYLADWLIDAANAV